MPLPCRAGRFGQTRELGFKACRHVVRNWPPYQWMCVKPGAWAYEFMISERRTLSMAAVRVRRSWRYHASLYFKNGIATAS